MPIMINSSSLTRTLHSRFPLLKHYSCYLPVPLPHQTTRSVEAGLWLTHLCAPAQGLA